MSREPTCECMLYVGTTGVNHGFRIRERDSRGVLDVKPLFPLLVLPLHITDRLGEVSPHTPKLLSVMPAL